MVDLGGGGVTVVPSEAVSGCVQYEFSSKCFVIGFNVNTKFRYVLTLDALVVAEADEYEARHTKHWFCSPIKA